MLTKSTVGLGNNLKLEIANDNSEIQIVISGNIEDLKKSRDFF